MEARVQFAAMRAMADRGIPSSLKDMVSMTVARMDNLRIPIRSEFVDKSLRARLEVGEEQIETLREPIQTMALDADLSLPMWMAFVPSPQGATQKSIPKAAALGAVALGVAALAGGAAYHQGWSPQGWSPQSQSWQPQGSAPTNGDDAAFYGELFGR